MGRSIRRSPRGVDNIRWSPCGDVVQARHDHSSRAGACASGGPVARTTGGDHREADVWRAVLPGEKPHAVRHHVTGRLHVSGGERTERRSAEAAVRPSDGLHAKADAGLSVRGCGGDRSRGAGRVDRAGASLCGELAAQSGKTAEVAPGDACQKEQARDSEPCRIVRQARGILRRSACQNSRCRWGIVA